MKPINTRSRWNLLRRTDNIEISSLHACRDYTNAFRCIGGNFRAWLSERRELVNARGNSPRSEVNFRIEPDEVF